MVDFVCSVPRETYPMPTLRKLFGKRLRYLRRQRNLTQEQLAELTELSVDFISLVERGINAPSFEKIEKLSQILSVPVKAFFDLDTTSEVE